MHWNFRNLRNISSSCFFCNTYSNMVALLTSVTLFQLKVEWIFDLKSIFLNSTETSVEGMVVKFLLHPPPSAVWKYFVNRMDFDPTFLGWKAFQGVNFKLSVRIHQLGDEFFNKTNFYTSKLNLLDVFIDLHRRQLLQWARKWASLGLMK